MLLKRSPFTAGFLSLIYPGLGHLYVGALEKALFIQAACFGSLFLLGQLGMLTSFTGNFIFLCIILCVYLYAFISAIRTAKNIHHYQMTNYNTWYCYVGFLLVFQSLFFYIGTKSDDLLGYNMIVMSSDSMLPSAQYNDVVIIDSKKQSLDVGDAIAFYLPNTNFDTDIKRVAAVGGDRISIIFGKVYRNGVLEEKLSVPEEYRQRDYSVSVEEQTVPAGHVFLLGDYRDNSNDSRFWGSLPQENIIGVATDVYFSTNLSNIGQSIN